MKNIDIELLNVVIGGSCEDAPEAHEELVVEAHEENCEEHHQNARKKPEVVEEAAEGIVVAFAADAE